MIQEMICDLMNSERGLHDIGEADLADKIRERLPELIKRAGIVLTEAGIRPIEDMATGRVKGLTETQFRRAPKSKPKRALVSEIEWI